MEGLILTRVADVDCAAGRSIEGRFRRALQFLVILQFLQQASNFQEPPCNAKLGVNFLMDRNITGCPIARVRPCVVSTGHAAQWTVRYGAIPLLCRLYPILEARLCWSANERAEPSRPPLFTGEWEWGGDGKCVREGVAVSLRFSNACPNIALAGTPVSRSHQTSRGPYAAHPRRSCCDEEEPPPHPPRPGS